MSTNAQPQTIMTLTQGYNPGYVVTEYLENQINANNGKFVMSFCDVQPGLGATRLEFRFINGVPADNIIMNFTQGCPPLPINVTEYITNQIKLHNGDFVMTFSLDPQIQLNTITFEFD